MYKLLWIMNFIHIKSPLHPLHIYIVHGHTNIIIIIIIIGFNDANIIILHTLTLFGVDYGFGRF